MASASVKDARVTGGNNSRPAAEKDFLDLLNKTYSSEDTKNLWIILKDGPLEGKGLIKLLREKKQISRMWEIAVGTANDIADLMVPNDEALKDLRDKTVKAPNDKAAKDSYAAAVDGHAAAAIKAMLPQAGQPHVKWIGKRGQKKGGWDSFSFAWARTSKGFPFKEDFEMTISAPDHQNQYPVEIIEGKSFSLLPIEWSSTSVPGSKEHCVAAFTFGNQDVTNRIIVYIRFASPTVLVGKAFKANWKDKDKELWGDLVLAKIN